MCRSEDFKKTLELWDNYLGDCNVLNKFLKKKPNKNPLWSSLWFLNVFFRSIGQTVFVNNPFLGLLFLIAITIGDLKAGLGCAVGGFISTLADFILGLHPSGQVDTGVSSFNGSLIGTVLPALFFLVQASEVELWVGVCFGAFISVFISSALQNSLGQLKVPFMTLPFNFVVIVSFLAWQNNEVKAEVLVEVAGNSSVQSVEWLEVVQGAVLSMGQVYAIAGLVPSLIMWAAVTLYSPLLASLSALGAVIGSLIPLLVLDPADYSSVYSGLWGYSCILSMVCVSWAVYPFSAKSFFLGVVNTVTTVFTQKALMTTLGKANLPVFTLPFTLSTLIIVLSWNQQGQKWRRTTDRDEMSLSSSEERPGC